MPQIQAAGVFHRRFGNPGPWNFTWGRIAVQPANQSPGTRCPNRTCTNRLGPSSAHHGFNPLENRRLRCSFSALVQPRAAGPRADPVPPKRFHSSSRTDKSAAAGAESVMIASHLIRPTSQGLRWILGLWLLSRGRKPFPRRVANPVIIARIGVFRSEFGLGRTSPVFLQPCLFGSAMGPGSCGTLQYQRLLDKGMLAKRDLRPDCPVVTHGIQGISNNGIPLDHAK